jgi:16S rRNA (uracil1498-N3)-methyltransferase
MEWVIEKATEVGLTSVHVWTSRRATSYKITPNRLARWRRIAAEACKQCGRRRIPTVDVCEELPGRIPEHTLGLVLDPSVGVEPLEGICRGLRRPVEVWLGVGPESGFMADEVPGAGAGWVRAGLGPRVLRSDTAGIVAASILLARWGDLGSAQGPAPDC